MMDSETESLHFFSGLLGVSTLVHTYCRENPSCASQQEVKAVVEKLSNILGPRCSAANDDARDGVRDFYNSIDLGHAFEFYFLHCFSKYGSFAVSAVQQVANLYFVSDHLCIKSIG